MNTNEIELISEKISMAFSTLSEKAGVATDYFWPILVRQEFLTGLVSLITWLLFTGGSLYILYRIRREKFIEGSEDPTTSWPTKYLFIAIVFGIALFFTFCKALISSGDDGMVNWIGRIYNPEYYAFKNIITLIK